MSRIQSLKEILAALKTQLPAQLTSFAEVDILPDVALDTLPKGVRLPLLGLVSGGYKGTDDLDPICEFKVIGVAMLEFFNIDPEAAIISSDKFKGALDLADEALAAITGLGDLGIDGIYEYFEDDELPKPELAVFGEKSERLALVQPFGYYYKKNE